MSSEELHLFEQWGTITVHDLGEHELARNGQACSLVVHRERHVWHPREDLDLSSGFELALECEEGPDSVRRWTPDEHPTAFVLRTSLAGQAILEQAGLLTKEQSHSYHSMRLFYQLTSRIGAYLRRQFKRKGDLLIPSAARIDSAKADVLPADLGCGPDGRGAPWSVEQLLAHGRRAAMRMEVDTRNEALIIHLGLFEAARLNPLDTGTMTKSEIRGVIRMGLFDLEDLSAVEAPVKAIVTERLLKALQKHLDDPPASFRKWFFEAVDNIVYQIAKKKRGGGQIDREVVWHAILEIAFDAYEYVAQCLQVTMKAFAGALPRPLTDAERDLFSLMYLRPATLGAIPLIMLHDRLPVLGESVTYLISSPADDHVAGTVLQMLRYIGEMSHNLRLADKLRKRSTKARNDQDRPALRLELGANIPDGKLDGEGQSPVIASLLGRRRAECLCATTDAWEIVEYPCNTEAEIELRFYCRECERSETIETSRQELLDIERSLQ